MPSFFSLSSSLTLISSRSSERPSRAALVACFMRPLSARFLRLEPYPRLPDLARPQHAEASIRDARGGKVERVDAVAHRLDADKSRAGRREDDQPAKRRIGGPH